MSVGLFAVSGGVLGTGKGIDRLQSYQQFKKAQNHHKSSITFNRTSQEVRNRYITHHVINQQGSLRYHMYNLGTSLGAPFSASEL